MKWFYDPKWKAIRPGDSVISDFNRVKSLIRLHWTLYAFSAKQLLSPRWCSDTAAPCIPPKLSPYSPSKATEEMPLCNGDAVQAESSFRQLQSFDFHSVTDLFLHLGVQADLVINLLNSPKSIFNLCTVLSFSLWSQPFPPLSSHILLPCRTNYSWGCNESAATGTCV